MVRFEFKPLLIPKLKPNRSNLACFKADSLMVHVEVKKNWFQKAIFV